MLNHLTYYEFLKDSFEDLELPSESIVVTTRPDADHQENILLLEQNNFLVEIIKPGIYKISW